MGWCEIQGTPSPRNCGVSGHRCSMLLQQVLLGQRVLQAGVIGWAHVVVAKPHWSILQRKDTAHVHLHVPDWNANGCLLWRRGHRCRRHRLLCTCLGRVRLLWGGNWLRVRQHCLIRWVGQQTTTCPSWTVSYLLVLG